MASLTLLGGLEGLGGAVQDIGKAYIADQLEKDRETRAEARQKAKEERDEAKKLATPVRENAITRRNPTTGAWEIQDANYKNEPLGSFRPLDEWAASQRDTQEKADRQSLENATLTGQLNQFKLGRAPIEAAQSDRLFEQQLRAGEANIGQAEAQAAYYRSGGSRGRDISLESDITAPVNDTDVATALIDEQADLLDQYNLSPQQKMDITLSAIRDARTAGKDPVDVLRRAIPSYVDTMKAKGYKFKPTKD